MRETPTSLRSRMPQWLTFIGFAIGVWCAVSVVAGFLIGPLLRACSMDSPVRHHAVARARAARRRPQPRLRVLVRSRRVA